MSRRAVPNGTSMSLPGPQWRLEHDLVSFLDLRLRLHRIGLGHWSAGTRLRSWGVAPLHRDGDSLQLPCADNEALWLGAWLEDDNASARVWIEDANRPWRSTIDVPPAFQITGLQDPDGSEHPLDRSIDRARRDLVLHLLCRNVHATIRLALFAPDEWAAQAGRPVPAALAGPPPLPPRLG